MSAREAGTRRGHGLKRDDPLRCPRCESTSYRAKFHWPSTLRGRSRGEKVEDGGCGAPRPG